MIPLHEENKLGVMPITKLIWNMSLPIIASMLVQALYNIVDSWFVSRVSEQALTAVSLAFPAQNLMIGLATGTAVGVNALMGRALGAGLRVTEWRRCIHAVHQFTHRRWDMTGWVLAVEGDGQGDWLWADAAAREEKAIPSAFRAFVEALE